MKQWVLWSSPFGRMLALIMVGFTLIPMLILTRLGIYNVQVQLQDSILTQTTTVAALIQQAVTKWIGEAKGQLASIPQTNVAQNMVTLVADQGDTSTERTYLNRTLFALTTRYFSDVYLVTPNGQIVVASQPDSRGKNLGINVTTLMDASKYSLGFYDSTFWGPHTAILWQPIRDQDRNIAGFLVGRIALDSLSSVIQNNTVGMGQTGETYLIDIDGLTVTQLKQQQSSNSPPRLFLNPLSTQYSINGTFSGMFTDYNAQPVIGVVQPLKAPISASIVVQQQQSEAFTSLYRIVNSAVILAIGLMVIAILASLLIAQRIIHPLQRLSAAAGSMAGGNLDTRVDIVRNDEIGVLATTFNVMALKLSQIFDELAQSNGILRLRAEQLSAINNVGQQAIAALDLNLLLDTAAEAIQQTFNYYAVALYLPDFEHSQLICSTVSGSTTNKQSKPALAHQDLANANFIGSAALLRELVNVPDVRRDARYMPDSLLPDTASEICVPLIFGTRLMGVLDIRSERTDAFVEHDLEMMNILAHQLAIAIRNAELFTDSEFARKLADDANRQKSEFLSNMSHELRTPLNVIIGYSSSMLSHSAMYDNIPLPDEYEEAVKGIMSGGQHLLGLINDILDLSKIEAGKIELSIEPMDPLPIIEGVRITAIGLVKPDVKVRADYDSKLPLIMGDELRIRQILLNLVSNAAKFTEHGTLTIDAQIHGDKLLFTVNDTGMGIAEAAQKQVFQRFQQATRDVQRSHGGSGLGLNIARQLVIMQGGLIWFESRLGHGTKFFFTIPLASDQTTLPAPGAKANKISSRVSLFDNAEPLLQQALVVDTDSQTRHTLQRILSQHNYDVLEADNRAQALELSELIIPNVVVIHLHQADSEGMHGLEACYRETPRFAGLGVVLFQDLVDISESYVLAGIAAMEKTTRANA